MAQKAYEQGWKYVTGLIGNTTVRDFPHTFVRFSDDDGSLVHNSSSTASVGVLQESAEVGQPAQVMTHGVSPVYAGTTVVAGQEVQAGNRGYAYPLTTGKSCGIVVVGGAPGDLVSVLLK